jgi:hypothetical protein
MLTASHSITAGAIGMAIGDPVLAFLLGIVIHFLLDAIPHWDTTDEGELTFRQWAVVFFDLFIALAIIFLLIRPEISWRSPFIWGAIGGVLPDFFDLNPLWKNAFRRTVIGKQMHYYHEKIQKKSAPMMLGIAVQVFFIAVFSALAVALN